MTTTEQTNFTAWNGETYAKLGGLFDTITELANSDEVDLDLEHDEILRLAIWAWNNHEEVNADTITKIIEAEQDVYQGEYESDANFTEETLTDTGFISKDLPSWILIDWQGTWDTALRFDFFTYDVVDIDGTFRKFYWRNY